MLSRLQLSRLLLSPRAQRMVEVREVSGKGRGLFALQSFPAGSVVMDDAPIAVLVPDGSDLSWSTPLSALDNELKSKLLRLSLRVALRVARECSEPQGGSSSWEQVRHLARADMGRFGEAAVSSAMMSLHEAMPATRVVTDELWRQLLGVVAVNAFALEGESLLFAGASMINHSCAPNVTLEAGNVFRAEVAIEQGDELTAGYCDLTLPAAERQDRLWWGYGFRCSCARCCSETRQHT